MAGKPFWDFYPGDWKRDPAVGKLTASARGVWVEILLAMHDDERSGILEGHVVQLARVCRVTVDELDLAIGELSDTRAADVEWADDVGRVRIINRRMRREFLARKSSRARVARHRSGRGGGGV